MLPSCFIKPNTKRGSECHHQLWKACIPDELKDRLGSSQVIERSEILLGELSAFSEVQMG